VSGNKPPEKYIFPGNLPPSRKNKIASSNLIKFGIVTDQSD